MTKTVALSLGLAMYLGAQVPLSDRDAASRRRGVRGENGLYRL